MAGLGTKLMMGLGRFRISAWKVTTPPFVNPEQNKKQEAHRSVLPALIVVIELALGELGSFPSFFQTVLSSFLHPWVTGKETGPL